MGYFKRLGVSVPGTNLGGPGGPFITMWHQFENDLISQGWRVLGSGDCLTYENQGQTDGSTGTGPGGGFDVITSALGGTQQEGTLVAGGRGNTWGFPYASGLAGASWRRLATPVGAEHHREYLITHNWKSSQNSTRHLLNVYMARDATAFSAGGTAQRAPLPVDPSLYVCIAGRQYPEATGTGQDATPDPVSFAPGGTGGYAHWFIGDAAEDYDFLFWNTRSSERSIFRMFGQLRLARLYAEVLGEEDTDPYVYICAGGATEGSSINVATQTGFLLQPNNPAGSVPARLESRAASADQRQEGVDGGVYLSWGLWKSGADPHSGTYSGSLWLHASGSGTGFIPAAGNITSDPTGRSLVQFNPPAGRLTAEAPGPRFFKGHVKNRLLGLSMARRDNPAQLEDFEGPNGASTGRRISFGYLHLPWEDGEFYLE